MKSDRAANKLGSTLFDNLIVQAIAEYIFGLCLGHVSWLLLHIPNSTGLSDMNLLDE